MSRLADVVVEPTARGADDGTRPRESGDQVSTRPLSRRRRLVRALATRIRLYQLATLLIVLGAWEYLGQTSPSFTFAPPSSVVPAAREMLASGELQGALTDSLLVLLLGLLFALAVGNAIGFAMGWWSTLGSTLSPFVAAGFVVPIVALIPLIVVWSGLGTSSRVIIVFLFALFEILFNAQAGVRNIDRGIIDVARTLGARPADMARKVVLPASLPFVLVGLRIGAIRALKGMVLAEMLFAVTGLGGLIIKYANLFRMDKVLVVITTLALIGILISSGVQAVERYALRWQPQPR